MKALILSLLMLPTFALAQSDVCCIMATVDGNNVTTAADYMTDMDCKPGKKTVTYTGAKTICNALSPDSADCSDRGPAAQEKRCRMCGFTWVDNKCYVEDLKAKAEELKAEKEKLKKKLENTKASDAPQGETNMIIDN